MRFTRIRATVLVAALSASLGLVACGDDDEPANGTDAPDSTDAPDDTDAPDGTDADDTDDPDGTDAPDDTDAPDGTDEAGESLTADEWREEVNALCEEARTAGGELGEPETVGDIENSFDEIASVGDDLFDQIDDLETPEELREGADRLQELWSEQTDKFDEAIDRLDDAGLPDDQPVSEISDEERNQLVGDAADNTALQNQASELGVACFGA